jgi:hypothetical protein
MRFPDLKQRDANAACSREAEIEAKPESLGAHGRLLLPPGLMPASPDFCRSSLTGRARNGSTTS